MSDPAKPTLGNNTNANVPMTPPTTPAKATFSPGPAIPDAMPASTSTQQAEPSNNSNLGGLTPGNVPILKSGTEEWISMGVVTTTDSALGPDLEENDAEEDDEDYFEGMSKEEIRVWFVENFGSEHPWADEDVNALEDGTPDLDYELGPDHPYLVPWSPAEEKAWNMRVLESEQRKSPTKVAASPPQLTHFEPG